MTDPSAVRFVESPPQPASGPSLQRAVLGSEHLWAEEYRFLAAKVASLAANRFTTVGIVSAGPGEGKTTVALGLAAALARSSPQRVLLLEADLRQPSLEQYLGLPPTRGVAEWLSGHSETVPISNISPPGFSVITAGQERLTRPELLGSERMGALVGACQLAFGFLVVDCPPLTPVADTVSLQDLLDGFLLVVRADYTPREAIEHAVGRLKDGRIQGIVFNDRATTRLGGYGHRQRGYGSRRRR